MNCQATHRSAAALTTAFMFLLAACGSDGDGNQAKVADASTSQPVDGALVDATQRPISDAANPRADAMSAVPDATPALADAQTRTLLTPGFCPSVVTAPGFYRGTLAGNLNDIARCGTQSAPGRDGAVRLELAVGATVAATLRHDGDGILYILDRCPVTTSCLDSSNVSPSSAEQVSYTNNTGSTNVVYVVLDSASTGGTQTFEFDLVVN